MIKYSVIVPVFNSFSSLKAILDWFSLEYSQRDGDIELIVVDDGSTDKLQYNIAQPGVRFFIKKNGGVSSARNLGLEESRGRYVSFLDSDDTYMKGFFQQLDYLLLDNITVLLFSSVIATDSYEKPIKNNNLTAPGSSVVKLFYKKEIHAHICSLVISKAFLSKIRIKFDESIGYSEDKFGINVSIL
jgi:glycosyltransferase involved in cell wall biosynthesis